MSACLMSAAVSAVLLISLHFALGEEYVAVCGGSTCPTVSWIDAPAGQPTSFTLRSSTQKNPSNYVAFAFATGQDMASAQVVVDCYDVNGNAAMGTSRNTAFHTNNVSPADAAKVFNRTARIAQGILTCSFNMVLPNSRSFVLIAEGPMDVRVSPATKMQHNGRYPSSISYTFSALTSTSPAQVINATVSTASTRASSGDTDALLSTSSSTGTASVPNMSTEVIHGPPAVNFTSIDIPSIVKSLIHGPAATNSTLTTFAANSSVADLKSGATMSPGLSNTTFPDATSTTIIAAASTRLSLAPSTRAKNAASTSGMTMDAIVLVSTMTSWMIRSR